MDLKTSQILNSTLAVILLLCGCGGSGSPEVGEVTGVVTLDDKPLPNATIMFQPQDGRPSQALTNDSGEYKLQYTRTVFGARLGAHVVNIRTRLEDSSGKVVVKEFLPKRYHDKTELVAEVKEGSNRIDFPLSSKP